MPRTRHRVFALFTVAMALCGTLLFGQDAAKPQDGFFTTSDGIKIHYLTLGGSGTWVVLIHGYADTAQRMWFTTGIAPVLARNHRVVALDNPTTARTTSRWPAVPASRRMS
jgi:pimeloyl-ACP methyl ester carboxylesterase